MSCSKTAQCYIALDASTNSEPPSAHWALLVAQGAAGEPGPQGNQGDSGLVWKGEWNNTTTYHASDVVECNGSSYVAIAANGNQIAARGLLESDRFQGSRWQRRRQQQHQLARSLGKRHRLCGR